MEMDIKKIKVAKGLVLASAIVCLINTLPIIGYYANFITAGIVSLLVLALAIVTVVFCARARMPKAGAIFAIVASALGCISIWLMLLDATSLVGLDMTDTEAIARIIQQGGFALLLFGFVVGLVAWVLFLVSTIILFINFAKIGQAQRDLEAHPSNYFPSDVTFNYQSEKDSDVLEHGNMTGWNNDVDHEQDNN